MGLRVGMVLGFGWRWAGVGVEAWVSWVRGGEMGWVRGRGLR